MNAVTDLAAERTRPASARTEPRQPVPESWLKRAAGAINQFFFEPADPINLGLIRICAGLLIFYVHLAYTYDLHEFFGRDAWMNHELSEKIRTEMPVERPLTGWLPPASPGELTEEQARYIQEWKVHPDQALAKGQPTWSAWFHVTDPRQMMALHIGFLVVMALFTVGFCTRVMAVLTWLAVNSYVQRAPNVLFGMDVMMNLTLLYLMIGPSGAALSVDRLIQRYWRNRRARLAGQPIPPPRPARPLVSARLALRLIQMNFCLIYFAAGLSKLLGSSWWNGTAMWWTMVNWEFAPLQYEWYFNSMRFLAEHRWLWELATSGGVVFTLLLEIGFPFLVWTRARPVMVCLAILLHTGIAIMMGLMTFGIAMAMMLIAFIAPGLIHRGLARLRQAVPQFQSA